MVLSGDADVPAVGGSPGNGTPRHSVLNANPNANLTANLAAVRARIDAACARAGRAASGVRLMPVTKTHPVETVCAVRDAGCRRVGENRVQEVVAKASALAADDTSRAAPAARLQNGGVEFAVIGHLQTNKAGAVARFAAEFQALDSLRLARELDKRCRALGRRLDVLVQVNSSGESSKSGLAPEDVLAFARELPTLDALRVRGLMTVALPSADPDLVAPCFERMRHLQRQLQDAAIEGLSWDELSMGMSDDFELAILHGSTCVRVGRALFGERAPATQQ